MMENIRGARFANTFLDIAKANGAILDEMMIDKVTGRLFYKNSQGDILDLFGEHSTKIDQVELENRFVSVLQLAKEYSDQQILDVSSGTQFRMYRYIYDIRATANQKEFDIPLSTFDYNNDLLLMTTNTVMPDEGYRVEGKKIIFDEGLDEGTFVKLIILKNVPVGEDMQVNAEILADGTINQDKLETKLSQKIDDARTLTVVSKTTPEYQPVGGMWFEVTGE